MSSRNLPRRARGFTLIELMVVIFIIGLLATVVTLNVLPSQDRAMVGKARADISTLEQAIETYRIQLRDKQQRPQDDKQGRARRAGSAANQVSVTVSMGVAERGVEQRNPDEVLKAADQALYNAKGAGRNCVRSYGQRRGAVKLDNVRG